MGELSMMLEPKDARVCMLDDDVPDLAGIAGVELRAPEREWSRKRRGWLETRQRFPEAKLRVHVTCAHPCIARGNGRRSGPRPQLNVQCPCLIPSYYCANIALSRN